MKEESLPQDERCGLSWNLFCGNVCSVKDQNRTHMHTEREKGRRDKEGYEVSGMVPTQKEKKEDKNTERVTPKKKERQ